MTVKFTFAGVTGWYDSKADHVSYANVGGQLSGFSTGIQCAIAKALIAA